jgi:hypothetical protein
MAVYRRDGTDGQRGGARDEDGRVMKTRPSCRGGAEGDRTLDLRIANATLSQLSYRPTKGRAL